MMIVIIIIIIIIMIIIIIIVNNNIRSIILEINTADEIIIFRCLFPFFQKK